VRPSARGDEAPTARVAATDTPARPGRHVSRNAQRERHVQALASMKVSNLFSLFVCESRTNPKSSVPPSSTPHAPAENA
jgi:hypothetical protein